MLRFTILCSMVLLTMGRNFPNKHNIVRRNVNIDHAKVYDFWVKHKDEFVVNEDHKEVVLFMGNTGSGKTTLISLLVGRKLRAVKQNGYFTIIDEENRIGTSASSKTLIPEAMIDYKRNVTYIDCPGFRDNRDVEHEISSIYLQNNLMSRVENIKLILVINYDSLKNNGNKNDFDDLLENISEFMKHMSNYLGGIAIVATKVENSYEESDDGTLYLANNNQIVLNGIADFLKSKRDIYRSKTANIKQYGIFIELINVLLEYENGVYTRIGIFRQPRRQGLLENLKTTRDEINVIYNIIQNLQYIKKSKDDFGYALSKSTTNTITEIVDDIFNNALTNRLYEMGNETLLHYLQMEKQYSDIDILWKRVSYAYTTISGVTNADKPLTLFKDFLEAVNTLNISVSLRNVNSISDDMKALQFFVTVLDKNMNTQIQSLKYKTQDITNSIGNLKSYYDFVHDLHINLAASNSQKLKYDTRIKGIIASCESSIDKVVENIADLESIVKEMGIDKMYDKIKTLLLNQFQLKNLKTVFETFSSELEIVCSSSSDQMIVKGYNVRTSDIIKSNCWIQAKKIEIFALNKVFIDCTINKTGAEAQLYIFSPTWEIIGEPKIILNGQTGEPHEISTAKSAAFPSEDGKNGLPGRRGGPAGNFFGVGKLFINLEFLAIHANGGNGGPGQHGGNGADGEPGEQISGSMLEKLVNVGIPASTDPNDILKHAAKYKLLKEDRKYTYFYTPTAFKEETDTYCLPELFGKPAVKPTNGGNGGDGAEGGSPGTIEIYGLGSSVNVATSNKPGSSGLAGQGGRGGKKTTEGQGIQLEYFCMKAIFSREYKILKRINGTEVPAGKDGQPGKNKQQQQTSSTNGKFAKPYLAIIKYKEFLRMHIFKNIKESALRTLVYEIESENRLKAQYNTLAFVKELEGLENQFLELRNKIDFVPFYESLLTRIEEFSSIQTILQNKKILSLVYTAALAKLFTLKKKRKGKTIVNLYQYLGTIETNVKDMHAAKHLQIVRNYRDEYQNTLNNKILDANHFIEKNIEPEINKLWDESDRQVKAMINEIEQNKNATEDSIISQQKEKLKLHNMMVLRGILLPLKLAATGLSFFGPIGAAAGVAVTTATTIAEGMLLDTTSGLGLNRMQSLDPNLKLMSRVTEVYNNKPQLLADKLNEVVEKLNKHNEELAITESENNHISQKIERLKTRVGEVKNRAVLTISQMNQRHEDAKNIEKELNEFINSQKDILEKEKKQLDAKKADTENAQKIKKELKIEKSLRRFNEAQSVLNGLEIIFSFVKKNQNDKGMIRNIDKQISSNVHILKDLEKLETQVYDVVVPDLRNIEDTINAYKTSIKESSHAKLDLTKWTVRKTLKDVKSLLQKFTHKMSFELQSNIARCLEKIDEGFSILIDIYDRIDSYSDSVKQAEYMAHIVSPPMTKIQITDSELKDAVVDLECIIQSNLLFEKYGTALHAFKQHYFPFAAHVLQTFQLPTNLQLNDTETMRSNIIQKIKDMKNHIDESQATLGEYSKYSHEDNVFNSNVIGSSPFYVWRYDTFANEIQALLHGSEILIKADISKGVNYNSVKYTDIGINIKLKNENLQKDFNAVLQNFALSMTMVGNNYYRCSEQYYFISFDENITISYTMNHDEANNWINPNTDYSTIRKSHAFLSPYVMWSIQLKTITNSIALDRLKRFANEIIDLELVGRGYYIEQDSDFNFNICNEYLETFYTVENIAKELR